MTDGPLIDAAKAGDHEAFVRLLARYDQQIMGVVYRFTGNCYDREDLYQEVFLHAYRALSGFRGEAAFSTWLYRLAFNRCIRYMKKARGPAPMTALAEVEDRASTPSGDNPEHRARLAAIHRAAAALPDKQRVCFHLYFVEGWDLHRIAQTLDMREGTVKSHLNRAKIKIRKDKEVLLWQTEAI